MTENLNLINDTFEELKNNWSKYLSNSRNTLADMLDYLESVIKTKENDNQNK